MNKKILIVEDKKDLAELLVFHLEKENFQVFWTMNGTEVFLLLKNNKIDLIILDLMLPKINGLEILRIIKADPELRKISVIIESAKSEDEDVIQGLKLGAEDYVTKPFSPKILLARIQKILSRYETDTNKVILLFEDYLKIDLQKHTVFIDSQIVHLTGIEFDLLIFFVQNKNQVVSREIILEGVWKDAVIVVDRVIDVHVNSLRKKLSFAGKHIKTIRGVGYIFLTEELLK